MINTVETCRQTFFIDKLLNLNKLILFIGPRGSGKTLLIRNYLSRMMVASNEVLIKNLLFTVKTTEIQTQNKIIETLKKWANFLTLIIQPSL